MAKKPEIRPPKEHYYGKYDSVERFSSYFTQISTIRRLNPEKILEIGIGNKTVSDYLKRAGYGVVTCDIEKELGPDVVADIRQLPFEDDFADVVTAFEVLEHIPYETVAKALSELHRVSKRHVVVSLPYHALSIELALFGGLGFTWWRSGFLLRIPPFFRKNPVPWGEHYWEIGRDGFPLKKVRALFEKKFRILKETRPVGNAYHYFFVLEKK